MSVRAYEEAGLTSCVELFYKDLCYSSWTFVAPCRPCGTPWAVWHVTDLLSRI